MTIFFYPFINRKLMRRTNLTKIWKLNTQSCWDSSPYSSHAFLSSNINCSNRSDGRTTIRVVHVSQRKVGSAEPNEDDGLHVCTFNKYVTRLESFFKIEILLKKWSPHELSISRQKKGFSFEWTSLFTKVSWQA